MHDQFQIHKQTDIYNSKTPDKKTFQPFLGTPVLRHKDLHCDCYVYVL